MDEASETESEGNELADARKSFTNANSNMVRDIFDKKMYYKSWWKKTGYREPPRNRLATLVEFSKLISSLSTPTSLILDVGCGTGTVARLLESKGCKNLVGIELENVFPNRKRISFIVGETTHLPLRPRLFDIVFARKFVSISDTRRSLRELFRIMKNDGKLVIEVPNVKRLKSRIYDLLGLTPTYPAKYFGHFHLASFKEVLIKEGFVVLQMRGDYVSIPLLGHPLSRLRNGIIPRLIGQKKPTLCLHLSAICKKRISP